MVKEAIDAFIAGEEWGKAKKVARELEPRYLQTVATINSLYPENSNFSNEFKISVLDLFVAIPQFPCFSSLLLLEACLLCCVYSIH